MIATETKQYLFFPLLKQDQFLFSKSKYTAFIGGVGSGKTIAGCVKALMQCHPGQDGAVIAPTYPMSRDVVQRTFFTMLELSGGRFEWSKSEEKAIVAGATVFFRTADSPERLRGLNLNWVYLDEAALMSEMVWKVVLGRLRIGEPKAWITTTPSGYNWVWRHFVESKDPQYEMIHASTRENIHLVPGYLKDLEDNYTNEFAKQEIDGEFVAFEGLVYSEFSRDIHVIRDMKIPEHWARVRSIDYGYQNPFVCLWGALDEDGRLYIYDEHYRGKTLIRDHAEAIKRRGGEYQFTVADHDAQENAELAHYGIASRNAQKDVIRGIQKLKARFAVKEDNRPRLFIAHSCTNTIRELGMYRWNETKEGRNDKEEPVKENDHAMDALRYLVMELDNKRVFVYAS